MLQAEKAEDEKARMKYGTDRWNRPASDAAAPQLFSQIAEIEGYLKSAHSSDELVQGKITSNNGILRVLTGTDRDLESFVPSSSRASLTPKVEKEASKLRGCLNDASRLESRRKRKIEALKDKARTDDINPELLRETARLEREFPMQKIEAAQFEDLFERRLQAYAVDQQSLLEDRDEQDQLSARLQETNAAFMEARKGDTSTKAREQALQKLENGYTKYKEIVSNLDVGRKFYNDLARIVNRFREDCKSFVHQRRLEAGQMEL